MQNQFLLSETAAEVMPRVPPSLTPATMETLPDAQAVTIVLAQAQRKVKSIKALFQNVILLVVLALLLLPLMLVFIGIHRWLFVLSLFKFLLPVASFLSVFTIMRLISRRPDFDLEALTSAVGTQAIPTLMDVQSGIGLSSLQEDTQRHLCSLLPQLKSSEASLLTARHRQYLNAALKFQLSTMANVGDAPEFALAILKAYEQVGDTKALPIVELLANSKPRNERQRKIRQAAEECLPLLRARVGDVDTTQTLLRASRPHMAAPDTLLRAAASETHAPPDELLHAAPPNNGPTSP